MWPESSEKRNPLRSGLTTGSCATACCVAAAQALLANKQPDKVEITLPKGKVVSLVIQSYEPIEAGRSIRTATIKDAGDDPDVTHGALVFVELRLVDRPGVTFSSAPGVGTVTRDGLVLNTGEPAINPVPRQMMQSHLLKAREVYPYSGGFDVAVGVRDGENIALKTMNPRLGIVGGLSILGTTGIVRPYSCSAYIASIHQGIDVAKANGLRHIAATTGSTSEAAIKGRYDLDDMALIEMGDFAGALLKHLRKVPIARVSLCGGFGKISKLANGHLDLNSRSSSIDFGQLVQVAEAQGADGQLLDEISRANTSMQVFRLCQGAGIPIGDPICNAALGKARAVLKNVPESAVRLEVFAVDRQGRIVGSASEGG
ncbi:MAG: cobalt-precorrin-5B (C(1))-methyltransferase [Gammaproteobacteria bacterium]|nr:MAG: cobalt-precorrin-5B (C(1))-methyltransferase [Pseudomonadota bacterium]PIE38046.1 MAG: cobalt-precorrin-5B (C(1))-methyltransferase [Gammaproteobacteria bacterium]